MSNKATVCIVDDDEAIREALQLLLFSAGLNSRVFSSADEFLAAENVEVECLLLDIRMPGMDGMELFHLLKTEQAPYPIIFITGHGDIPLAVATIKQGAFDFLTKPFKDGELLAKINQATAHYAQLRQKKLARMEVHQRMENCTPRETDVLFLMIKGLPNKGIADALSISPRTVEIHRAHVMEKMEAESLPDLVRMLATIDAED